MGTGSVVARPWLRRGIVIAIIAALSLVALQVRLTPFASATHLDGTEFSFTKNVRFAVKKVGKRDVWFYFRHPVLGDGIRFGANGPGTFELLNGGIDDDGVGTADTPHLRGTYGPKPHASSGEVDAQDHKDLGELDNDSLEDIAKKLADVLEGKLEIRRDATCAASLDHQDLLDLPAITMFEDAEGRVVMDLPALKFVGPASCSDGGDWDLKVRSGDTRVRALPNTGPSAAATAAKGGAIAAASIVGIGVLRRRRPDLV